MCNDEEIKSLFNLMTFIFIQYIFINNEDVDKQVTKHLQMSKNFPLFSKMSLQITK